MDQGRMQVWKDARYQLIKYKLYNTDIYNTMEERWIREYEIEGVMDEGAM
jgi:hypothetical protein